MASPAEAFECRQRQLCELEALQAMYDVDGSFTVDDKDAHEILRATVESCSSPEEFCPDGLPCLGFQIKNSSPQEPAVSHNVHFLLPASYPEESAVCKIEWNSGSRADHEFLNGIIGQYAASLAGEESCLQLVQRAEEVVREAHTEKTQDVANDLDMQVDAAQMMEALEMSTRKHVLGRRLIYFHHIINEGKRSCIVDWAVQLQLGGYSKIGWPGVIVVEGPEECCQEYVRSLQRLRWQLMVVRGEEMEECPEGAGIDDLRKLHRGFEETDNMSLLADRCRQGGLEELFLTSMKIYGRRSDGAKKGGAAHSAEPQGKKAGGSKRR